MWRGLDSVAMCLNFLLLLQEVLWDNPPIPENQATCALFYSISSTQVCAHSSFKPVDLALVLVDSHNPFFSFFAWCWLNLWLFDSYRMYLQPGLAGINLGKFLIKRVITLVKKDMPHVSVSTLTILYKTLLERRVYLLFQQSYVFFCSHLQHLVPFLDLCNGSSRSYHLNQDLLKVNVVHRAIRLHLLLARKYYYQKRNKPSWVYQSKNSLIKFFMYVIINYIQNQIQGIGLNGLVYAVILLLVAMAWKFYWICYQ